MAQTSACARCGRVVIIFGKQITIFLNSQFDFQRMAVLSTLLSRCAPLSKPLTSVVTQVTVLAMIISQLLCWLLSCLNNEHQTGHTVHGRHDCEAASLKMGVGPNQGALKQLCWFLDTIFQGWSSLLHHAGRYPMRPLCSLHERHRWRGRLSPLAFQLAHSFPFRQS